MAWAGAPNCSQASLLGCQWSPPCPGSPAFCSPIFSQASPYLALYLLLLRAEALSRSERIGLAALIAISAATHSATFALLLVLLAAGALLAAIDRTRLSLKRLGQGCAALAFGALLVLAAANALVAKRLAWTPGGFALSFGRKLQDGIVTKYLNEHCPRADLILCKYKDDLPRNADQWFWEARYSTSSGASLASVRKWSTLFSPVLPNTRCCRSRLLSLPPLGN
jgi:hypothetical protein